MNFDFLDRRSAERFAELLEESTDGRRRPRLGPAEEQLTELVSIGSSLSAARPAARVDPEFRTGLRAMLVATAERDGIGRTDVETEVAPAPVTPIRSGLRAGLLGRGGRRIRARGAIVIGVAAGAMAVSGISAASENASPGDALYGVKRSTERAQLAMAGSDVTRGQLSLTFARNRLAEAAAMVHGGVGFGAVLNDMDADTLKGVKLLHTLAVARRDTKPLAAVDDFANRQSQTLLPVLERLGSVDRERAMNSLTLLDSVRQRSGDLRAGLACTPITPAGTDRLGPKLRDCAANAGGAATSRPSGHSGKSTAKPKVTKAKPERSAPTVAPNASRSTAPVPKGGVGVPQAPIVTPSQSVGPVDPRADEDLLNDSSDGLIEEFFGEG
ncbi:MAG TPA: DUF5667 domain-containing protein [Actinoplanes sp.]